MRLRKKWLLSIESAQRLNGDFDTFSLSLLCNSHIISKTNSAKRPKKIFPLAKCREIGYSEFVRCVSKRTYLFVRMRFYRWNIKSMWR